MSTADSETGTKMYLVSAHWGNSMNIGLMRLVRGKDDLKTKLIGLAQDCYTPQTLEQFVTRGSYRVYEMGFNTKPKLIKSKRLAEILK